MWIGLQFTLQHGNLHFLSYCLPVVSVGPLQKMEPVSDV